MTRDSIDVLRISISVSAFGLWISDIASSHMLFTQTPYYDSVATSVAVMRAMYLISGPVFVLGPLLDAYLDEPPVNSQNLPSACAVKLTLPYAG